MDFEIKFKSISKHWVWNVFAPAVISVSILTIAACLFVRSYYIENIKRTAKEYVSAFSLLAGTDSEYFVSGARNYCEQFEHKDKLEVMVIDNKGEIVVSTMGIERSGVKMPDYQQALNSQTGSAVWIGRSEVGETVLAGTEILADYGSGSNGAVRYVVSLKECNKRVFVICAVIIVLAVIILFFNVFSGFFFIKSIAKPVREVSAAARKIALGDYKEEIKTDRIDEIGELCDSINYMQAELKSAEQLKNDFISSVSHELRTPLTAIRGWAETSKMSVGYDEQLVIRGLDVVLSESDRLSDLVEELLDFSRMQSGRMSIEMMPIGVVSVLKEAVDMYVELAREREIEITFAEPKTETIVNGDKNRLKQVLINIIDNAVKYTNEKGQVLIEVAEADGCVRIVVKDTGVGIPASDIDHVKEKFYKANKEVRGSGIGLAVADEIVKQMGGLLFLESTEGIGTTVTVVLPLYIAPEEPTETVLTPEGEDITEEGANNG